MSPEVPKIISCWLLKISLHPPFRMTTFGNNKKTEMTDGNKIWYTNMTVGNIMNISPTPSFMLIGAFEHPELFCQTATDLKHSTANLRGPPTWNQDKTPPGNSLWMKLKHHKLQAWQNPPTPKKHINLSCPGNTTSTKQRQFGFSATQSFTKRNQQKWEVAALQSMWIVLNKRICSGNKNFLPKAFFSQTQLSGMDSVPAGKWLLFPLKPTYLTLTFSEEGAMSPTNLLLFPIKM